MKCYLLGKIVNPLIMHLHKFSFSFKVQWYILFLQPCSGMQTTKQMRNVIILICCKPNNQMTSLTLKRGVKVFHSLYNKRNNKLRLLYQSFCLFSLIVFNYLNYLTQLVTNDQRLVGQWGLGPWSYFQLIGIFLGLI